MTGFGTASAPWASPEGPAALQVELRSVNARFLEVKLRQPFGAATEQALRGQIGARLGRGRVDLSITVRRADTTEDSGSLDALASFGVDRQRLDQALAAVAKVAQRAAEKLEVSPVNPAELLRLLMSSTRSGGGDAPLVAPVLLPALLDRALDALVEFRAREGEALSAAIGKLADDLAAQVAALSATLAPESERIAARIKQRIDELTVRLAGESAPGLVLDPDRIAQEVAVVVARGDVTEELDRIGSHLSQLREVLAGEAATGQGKTLEFLAQELFREITTIGSKITSHDGSRIVIEAKGTIERIREQVHNVE